MTQPYALYRDSGLAWFGKVPDHWSIWKLRRVVPDISSGTTPRSDDPDFYDHGTVPWVNTGDLNDGVLREIKRSVTERALTEHSTLKWHEPGALIIAMYGATIGKLGILSVSACVNQACCVFGKSPNIHQSFLFYWLFAYRDHVISLASGGGQPNISQDVLRNLKIPRPPLDEQQAIVAFLDRETGKIDAAVEEQRRLIALLKEKRQAVIAHAVTKGLNPDAPMKPSGIDWLGDIPEHWNVGPLKRFGAFEAGAGFPIEEQGIEGEEIPFFKVNAIGKALRDDQLLLDEVDTISRETAKHLRAYVFPVGTIVFAKIGAALLLGRVRVLSSPSCIDNNMMGFMVDPPNSAVFFRHLLGLLRFDLLANPGAVPSLNERQIANEIFPVPDPYEQAEIASWIEDQTVKFDALISEAETAIDLLKERRSALISAAVTGKIDVRGEVAGQQGEQSFEGIEAGVGA